MIIEKNSGVSWARIILTSFIIALAFHFLLISGVISNLTGAHRLFYGHVTLVSWLIIIYPLLVILSAVLVSTQVKKRKILNFFITVFASVIFNVLILGVHDMYVVDKERKEKESMYEKSPQSRPHLDPQRPLTIIKTLSDRKGVVSPIGITVYAVNGVLDEGKNMVEIRGDAFPDSKIWGEGVLESNGELAPDGKRIMYFATIKFSTPASWEEALVIIKGNNGEFEFITIHP